jgi:hypothetical protein
MPQGFASLLVRYLNNSETGEITADQCLFLLRCITGHTRKLYEVHGITSTRTPRALSRGETACNFGFGLQKSARVLPSHPTTMRGGERERDLLQHTM